MNTEHGSLHPGPDDPVDAATLDRYLAGESSPDERVIVDRWIAVGPGRAEWLGTIRGAVAMAFGSTRVDANQAREVLARWIGEESGSTQTIRRVWHKRVIFSYQPLRRRLWSATAAVGLGLIVLVIGWSAGVRHNNKRATQASLIYATGNGERATITLPDGGTVALNVASRLEVPADYMADNHTVRLVGQGLFTVSHHDG
ncbi:MAG TPA: FecR domain-containing protein, partial [Gemmatimonadaceae bacterium]|nr:FecR domain-containing protein [Gemmatimonadaceae bacterium]